MPRSCFHHRQFVSVVVATGVACLLLDPCAVLATFGFATSVVHARLGCCCGDDCCATGLGAPSIDACALAAGSVVFVGTRVLIRSQRLGYSPSMAYTVSAVRTGHLPNKIGSRE